MVFLLVGGALLLFAIGVVVVFNRLVALRNRFRNAFAQVDVQLKRRHDLIPNLVETTKGYMAHERGTLEAVIQARSAAGDARKRAAANPGEDSAMDASAAAEGALMGQVGKLIALWESYPDLKADAAAARLMEELASAENRIAFARQAYNDSVLRYNTAREVFPSNLVAGLFAFEPASLYQIDDDAERAVPSARLDREA